MKENMGSYSKKMNNFFFYSYSIEGDDMNKIFRWIYTMTILLMITCIVILGLLIANKYDFIELKPIFNYFQRITTYLPFEFMKKNQAIASGISEEYVLINDHQYHNGTNQVFNLYDGIVYEVGEDYVEILFDNQKQMRFEHMSMIHVQKHERVLKGVILGSYYDYIELYCFDESGKEISYDQMVSAD